MKKGIIVFLFLVLLCGCKTTVSTSEIPSKKEVVSSVVELSELRSLTFAEMMKSIENKDYDLEEMLNEINTAMNEFDITYQEAMKEELNEKDKQKIRNASDEFYKYLNEVLDALEKEQQQ